MTWNRSHRISLWLTGLAVAVLAASLLWISLLEPDDWNTLLPFYMMVFVAGPLGALALAAAVFGAAPGQRLRTLYLILGNLAIIAGPWIWLAIVT